MGGRVMNASTLNVFLLRFYCFYKRNLWKWTPKLEIFIKYSRPFWSAWTRNLVHYLSLYYTQYPKLRKRVIQFSKSKWQVAYLTWQCQCGSQTEAGRTTSWVLEKWFSFWLFSTYMSGFDSNALRPVGRIEIKCPLFLELGWKEWECKLGLTRINIMVILTLQKTFYFLSL